MATDVISFDALIGNRNGLEALIGFEPITRAARLLLFDHLNDEIDSMQERWMMVDLGLDQMGLDPGVGQVELDHFEVENLHEGAHQSILTAPPEAFPNCSVMAYAATPSGEQYDQFDTSDIALFAETFVIAGPVPKGSDLVFSKIVNRRIMRTTEAVNNVLMAHKTFLGTTTPVQLPPRGGIVNSSWLKHKDGSSGPRYLVHGSKLQYTLQRHARFS